MGLRLQNHGKRQEDDHRRLERRRGGAARSEGNRQSSTWTWLSDYRGYWGCRQMQVYVVDGLRLPGLDSDEYRGDGDASSSNANGRMYQQARSLEETLTNKII